MKKFIITFLTIFTMIVTMCTSVLASEHAITPPVLSNSCDAYVVFYYYNGNDFYYQMVMYNSDDWTLTKVSNNTYEWTKNRETAYVRYYSNIKSSNYSASWGTMQQYDNMSMSGYSYRCDVVDSNIDLYDSEGSLFFQGMTLEEVTNKNLQKNLVPKVVGTITTLTLCGVGCLALLMVSKVFGKVFATFRV